MNVFFRKKEEFSIVIQQCQIINYSQNSRRHYIEPPNYIFYLKVYLLKIINRFMFSFVTCFWLSLSSMRAASLSALPWPVHNPSSFPTFDKGSSFIKQDAILGSLLKIFGVKILDKIHGRHPFIPLPTFAGRLGPAGHGSKLLMRARSAPCVFIFLGPSDRTRQALLMSMAEVQEGQIETWGGLLSLVSE